MVNMRSFVVVLALGGALVACSSESKKTDKPAASGAAPVASASCTCSLMMSGCGCDHCSAENEAAAPACDCASKRKK